MGDIMRGDIVIVKSGGDIATGIIQKLHRSGFRVLVLEIERPTTIRRTVSFSEAVYTGSTVVEDLLALRVSNQNQIIDAWEKDYIPVIIDPFGEYIQKIKPLVLIDSIIAKKNLGMKKNLAPLTIGIGPGFCAGLDVDVVIESNRGHNLGRLIYNGYADENTGEPGNIQGFTKERVIYSPASGFFRSVRKIGDLVKKGELLGYVGDVQVVSLMDGLLRGCLKSGLKVSKGLKIFDLDPRLDEIENCFKISDKARTIAGGVLEAILIWKNSTTNKMDILKSLG